MFSHFEKDCICSIQFNGQIINMILLTKACVNFCTQVFNRDLILHWLIFCQESLAAPITNKLRKKWLDNTEYHLESGLATKAWLNEVMVSAEKKRKFWEKISASVTDNSKYQFDQCLKVVQCECKEEFLDFFSFKRDHLDIFFAPFLVENDSYNNVWAIGKIVFILSHDQIFTEIGFSINHN